MEDLTKRQKIDLTTSELKLQRVQYEPHWKDVSQYLMPYRLRLQLADQNRGDRRNLSIYDSTATTALSALEGGMMAMITSPAKPWLRLVTKSDPDLVEFGPVKQWLEYVTLDMLSIFSRSNAYITLPQLYGDMAGFATGAMSIEEHMDDVIHTRTLPCGSYWIGQDMWGRVNTFYREFRMTVAQLYKKFGKEGAFSQHVQDLIEKHKWQEWVDIAHIVQPNDGYDSDRPMAKYKKFYSCWFEMGSSSKAGRANYLDGKDGFIKESGFDSFPSLVGRWKVTEGDVYGIDCPGMRAIGDIKTLQIGEKRAWQGVEKIVNPHWIAPTVLKGQDNGFLPGDTTFLDEFETTRGIRPLYEVNGAFLSPLEEKQKQVRERIYKAFHFDLFRMLDLLDDRERTATEIAARQGEKIEQLAPTGGHIERDVLRPLIDRTFEIMVKQGRVPPPPEELEGEELDIEYLGVLSQAQKSISVNPIERLVAMVTPLVEVQPDVLDKIDFDQAIDEAGHSLSIPAKVIRSDEEVAQIRGERAQAMKAQQAMQMAEQGSKAAKNLAQAPMDGDSALKRLMGAA